MALRQRVRAASASASLHFGRKPAADDPLSLSFWLCEGLKKKSVRAKKSESLETALREWGMLDVLDDPDLHFMNEATGIVVPRGDEMGQYISERDVVRICSGEELGKLLEKFATRDVDVDAEILNSQKPNSSLGAALGKLRKIGNTSAKMIQKTFDDRQSPHANEADLLERFPEIDPVFEDSDVEELPEDTPPQCDMCDVSWPDDASGRMHRLRRLGVVTHRGCAQFAADVLAARPELATRAQLVAAARGGESNPAGTFHVTVHRATDLPGAALLGPAAPYAKLSLLPWEEPVATKAAESGGRNPLWKSVHDNRVQLAHLSSGPSTPLPLLEVEVWNANYLADDLVACALVDMTPLLRFPRVELKRWFSLSPRAPAGVTPGPPPKLLLSVAFVPLDAARAPGREHKFRVHQLKSIGLAIPNCVVCDRVIMNVMKGAWGYRCEHCGVDVHKGCIMKAVARRACDASAPAAERVARGGALFTVVDGVDAARSVGELFVHLQGLHLCSKQCQPGTHAKNIFEGDTYCRLALDGAVHETAPVLKSADPTFHERVCFRSAFRDARLRLEAVDFGSDASVGELSLPLLELLQRDADALVRSSAALDRLRGPLRRLARAAGADASLDAAERALLHELRAAAESARFELLAPAGTSGGGSSGSGGGTTGTKSIGGTGTSGGTGTGTGISTGEKRRVVGHALLRVEYVERRRALLRLADDDDDAGAAAVRDVRDVTVESLRATVDRFGRLVRALRRLALAYDDVISWKDRRASALCLALFVLACVCADLEYALAYVLGTALLYMLWRLHARLEGGLERRWVAFRDVDAAQSDALRLHRPLARLRVAVHDAAVSRATDALLRRSQALLKDARLRLFVRVTYRPNDRRGAGAPPASRLAPRFVASDFESAVVAWTHAVDASRRPVWRLATPARGAAHAAPTFAPQFVAKQKKDWPLRNVNVSWRHCVAACACARCVAARDAAASGTGTGISTGSTGSGISTGTGTNEAGEMPTGGVDHHAFYFPVPQAVRKNFAGRDDLAPWRLFPGELLFELCASLSGDAKETPDLVVAAGAVPLKDVRARASATQELDVALTTAAPSSPSSSSEAPASSSKAGAASVLTPSSKSGSNSTTFDSTSNNNNNNGDDSVGGGNDDDGVDDDDRDLLRVRIEFQVPSSSTSSNSPPPSSSSTEPGDADEARALLSARAPRAVSRAERRESELVLASLAAKEPSAGLGGHLFDAFWRVKDTLRSVQHGVRSACALAARAEQLLEWTHPWKSAAACGALAAATLLCALVPGRWLLLAFGLSEFGAGFVEDLPPSNHARSLLARVLASLPTDEDLLDVYAPEREAYDARQRARQERDDRETLRLRHHALWVGHVLSKGESDRSYKNYFMAYRPFRFVLWKSVEDAESGAPPHQQLIFERAEAVVSKIDDSSFVFHVFGVTASGAEEKRSFSFESLETKEQLERIVQRSCDES